MGDQLVTDEPGSLLTLAEICARYHVSDRRARDIVRQHGVPILVPGRAWLFDERAETAFREATRRLPAEPEEAKPARGKRVKWPRSTGGLSAFDRVMALTADTRKSQPGRKSRSG